MDSPTNPKTGTDRRREVLKQVEACVCKDRQATYSDAEDNFRRIAAIWTVLLEQKLKPGTGISRTDVAAMCAGIKLARIVSSPGHPDNWTDLAGYGVCGGGIVLQEAETKPDDQSAASEVIADRKYRMLDVGETIQKGDEVSDRHQRTGWRKAYGAVGLPIVPNDIGYWRRPC
jgi:hypothetical protein